MAARRRTRRGRSSDREMLVRVMLIGLVVASLLFIASRVSAPSGVPQIQPPQAPAAEPPRGPAVSASNYTGTFKYFERYADPPAISVAEGKTYSITFRSNNTNGLPGTGGDLFVYPDDAARPGTCTGPANPETMALGDGTTFVNRSGVRGTFQTPPLFADITIGGMWQGALFIESGEWQPGYVRLTARALEDAVVPLLNDDTKLDDNSGCAVVMVEEI